MLCKCSYKCISLLPDIWEVLPSCVSAWFVFFYSGPCIRNIDEAMLLLKATSQATIYCLSNCLSMLQQQQIALAYTPPSTFHSASSASTSGGVLPTRKTSTVPSVQYYECDAKKRYVVSGYFPIDMYMSYGWRTHWNDLQHDLDSKTLPEHNSNDVTTR